ncbi:MAG: M20/M25/M40 family metallo-hydrolase [Saprospiraceae bacterium]|nr:M20/M25/M40 family metallo-hydrolase [Saprospiraceae bacterium]
MKKRLRLILFGCVLSSIGFTQSPSDETIEKYTQQSFQEFYEFLTLPNDASIPEQLEANINWVSNAFQKRGFTITRLPTKSIDLILAEQSFPGAQKTVMFYMHVDGQSVDPIAWKQKTPFTPTLKAQDQNGNYQEIPWSHLDTPPDPNWRIYARSSSDAKGPIVMFLAALDAMKEEKTTPNYNIKIIMDNEEEIGSPSLPEAVVTYREKLAADMLVILDGPMHVTNRPTLAFGARGIAKVRITTYGPRVPQHSGHYGNYAPNPAIRLAQLLASMKDEEGRVTIPGFYDGISLSDEVKEILASVPDDENHILEKLGVAAPEKVGANLQEAIQYPSLNIRGMSSGWVGRKVRTIIPAAAVANLDIRLVKESDPERLIQLIRNHIEERGYHILETEPTDEERKKYPRLLSMANSISYQAFRTDLNSPIGNWLSRALVSAHGEVPIKIRSHGGSVPIAPFVNTLNVPAVIVPVVNSDNNQHSPNENVRLREYYMGVRTFAGILSENIN